MSGSGQARSLSGPRGSIAIPDASWSAGERGSGGNDGRTDRQEHDHRVGLYAVPFIATGRDAVAPAARADADV